MAEVGHDKAYKLYAPSWVQFKLEYGVYNGLCCILIILCYLVDPASSHMLVSKIKPCMSKYKSGSR